ncbi:MAG: recombination mediator RecR [Candidatus Omnitrophica bacterium]|jgi:recombination protein RecR|nr:recombination mediator RecR [Candidatus Omnitrophota bacterium]MDD5080336.1 recombination mediator RecR [Candidatus Omnitrophota bacterium]
MANYTESTERLINSLIKLPGIGRRSAERIVGYILSATADEIKKLAEAVIQVKENVHFCSICHNMSEGETCAICQDVRRDKAVLCVVERPSDVTSIEKTGQFHGLYHVLLGSIAPLEGKGPDDLKIDSLLLRIKDKSIQEVIIATDSDTEGEATALYLTKVVKPLGVTLSRIGLGLPVGSNLEYADPATLTMALESRRPV